MAVPPTATKADIRDAALAARKSFVVELTTEARSSLEQQLAATIFPHLDSASVIALYHPMRDEISPLPLAAALAGRTIAFPWFGDRDARMLFRSGPPVAPGPWNILQPRPAASAVAPDTVIVPLVHADRLGTRIGHGKGHYDRMLANLRTSGSVRAIGVGWTMQIGEMPLTPDPWDIRLDAIATPKEWIDCRG